MKKIKITTDRTWVGGKKAEKGQTYEVTAEEAEILLLTGSVKKLKRQRQNERVMPKGN